MGGGACLYQMFDWWRKVSRSQHIKADLEILEHLDKDSEQYEMVKERTEELIWEEYGGCADLRRRTLRSLLIWTFLVAFVVAPLSLRALLSGHQAWGIAGLIGGLGLILVSYFNYRTLPE